MSAPTISIALIFGGKSPEHSVSIRSARNIFQAIDKTQYTVHLIGINQHGQWFHLAPTYFDQEKVSMEEVGKPLCLIPGKLKGQISFLHSDDGQFPQIEVAFPITHGPYGEDGSLQGILRHLNIPFVGPDILGSAVSMDKDVCKRLLLEADLLTARFQCFHYYEKDAIDYVAVRNLLGSPLFIKPANMGSSVGVSKADSKESFEQAIQEAFRYDHKIIVEEAIVGRELECAVMGNAEVRCTHVGEVAMEADAGNGLYDYHSKYVSENAAKILIPAPDISVPVLSKLTLIAQQAYRVLGCEGMSRVDMFLTEDEAVYINEINTLPGFTSISMYPKLWAHTGTDYPTLIAELIQLAIEKGKREAALEKSL